MAQADSHVVSCTLAALPALGTAPSVGPLRSQKWEGEGRTDIYQALPNYAESVHTFAIVLIIKCYSDGYMASVLPIDCQIFEDTGQKPCSLHPKTRDGKIGGMEGQKGRCVNIISSVGRAGTFVSVCCRGRESMRPELPTAGSHLVGEKGHNTVVEKVSLGKII